MYLLYSQLKLVSESEKSSIAYLHLLIFIKKIYRLLKFNICSLNYEISQHVESNCH